MAAGPGGPFQRHRRQVEGRNVMLGLRLVGGHTASHVAETNEGDTGHADLSTIWGSGVHS